VRICFAHPLVVECSTLATRTYQPDGKHSVTAVTFECSEELTIENPAAQCSASTWECLDSFGPVQVFERTGYVDDQREFPGRCNIPAYAARSMQAEEERTLASYK